MKSTIRRREEMRIERKWDPDVHVDILGSKIDIGDRLVYTSIKQGYSLLFSIVLGYTKSRLRILRETGVETTLSPKHVMVITEQIDLYNPDAPAHTGTAKEYLKGLGLVV
jgi:hypothetical protein